MNKRSILLLLALGGLLASGAASAGAPAPPAAPSPPAPPAPPADAPDAPEALEIDAFSEGPVRLAYGGRRAYLGATLLDLTEELRVYFGAPRQAGVLVSRVEPESPAAKAGLKVGDVLTGVDGAAIASARQLAGAVRHKKEGEKLELAGIRERKALAATAVVGKREKMRLDLGDWLAWGPDEEIRVHVDRERIQRQMEKAREQMERAQSRVRERFQHTEQLEKRLEEMDRKMGELEKKLSSGACH